MPTPKKLVDAIGQLLVDELAAVHQYIAHEAWARNRGYAKLADKIKARGESEHEHADELLERLAELGADSAPFVTASGQVDVKDAADAIVDADEAAEVRAVDGYNAAIATAAEARDGTSQALFLHIVAEETAHLTQLRAEQAQREEMGLENWLSLQV